MEVKGGESGGEGWGRVKVKGDGGEWREGESGGEGWGRVEVKGDGGEWR